MKERRFVTWIITDFGQKKRRTVHGPVDDDAAVRPASDVVNPVRVELIGADALDSDDAAVFLPRPQRRHHNLYTNQQRTRRQQTPPHAGTPRTTDSSTSLGRCRRINAV